MTKRYRIVRLVQQVVEIEAESQDEARTVASTENLPEARMVPPALVTEIEEKT